MPDHGVLKPSGVLIEQGLDGGGEKHQDTVQCSHCGRHWVFKKGSKKKRGFCLLCNGITCGNKRCQKCIPQEKQLEALEKGIPWESIPDHPFPVSVSFALPDQARGVLLPDGIFHSSSPPDNS